jgi:WD40 repeat protein
MIVFKAGERASTGVAFSPDGRFLATTGFAYSTDLWACAEKPERVRTWPGSWGVALSFSPDGRFLARGGLVRVWEVEGDDEPILRPSKTASDALAFSPTGREFAICSEAGLQRWAVPSWRALPGGWGGTRASTDGDSFPTGGLAYSSDGSRLATCFGIKGQRGYDSLIRVWDAKGKLRHSLRSAHQFDHPSVVRFSPDGLLLAAVYGPILRVWDVAAERELVAHKTGRKHLKGLAFTADGKRLAAVSNDATVRLWDAPDWNEAGGFEWKIGKLVSLDISRDGCRMAAGSDTGKVVIWDVD